MKTYFSILIFRLLSWFRYQFDILKGKISNGIYYSHLGNFSIPIPDWQELKIQDSGDNDSVVVAFLDHSNFPINSTWSITSNRLLTNEVAVVGDPSQRDSMYLSFLMKIIMPQRFKPVCPQARIVHEELLGEGNNRMFFAVVNIPDGHTFIDPANGKRTNSVSGLLIFHQKGFMYMIRNEMKSLLDSFFIDPFALNSRQLESSRKSLLEIKNKMRFIN